MKRTVKIVAFAILLAACSSSHNVTLHTPAGGQVKAGSGAPSALPRDFPVPAPLSTDPVVSKGADGRVTGIFQVKADPAELLRATEAKLVSAQYAVTDASSGGFTFKKGTLVGTVGVLGGNGASVMSVELRP